MMLRFSFVADAIAQHSELNSMRQTIEEDDKVDLMLYGVFADRLEDEQMFPSLQYAYRWMMMRGRRPHKRNHTVAMRWDERDGNERYVACAGKRVPYSARWAWYGDLAPEFISNVFPTTESQPHKLPYPLLANAIKVFTYQLTAVVYLANVLERCHEVYSHDKPKAEVAEEQRQAELAARTQKQTATGIPKAERAG